MHFKRDKLKNLFIKFDIDILSLTELGQNLRRIDNSEQLRELTRGWVENIAVRTAHNRHYDSGRKRQYGGTALVVGTQLSSRLAASDIDPSGLGRWTSTLIQGKVGFKTRVISAYRPCPGTSEGSVNIQHHLYFAESSIDPRSQFLTDLADQICAWQDQGEQIILTGDMNTGELTSEKRLDRFWEHFLHRTGLVDAHKQHLQRSWLPNTHNRGKVQIDYIFISPSIKVKRAGFLPFEKIPSDHRGVWVDIDTPSITGSNPPTPVSYKARRLKLTDPRIVAKYQDSLLKSIAEGNLSQRIENLHQVNKEGWDNGHTEEYQRVAQEYRSQMIAAESKCRRLRTGAHPWSPHLDEARKTMFLWDLVVKQGQGLSVPVKKILKLSKQLGVSDTCCSLIDATKRLIEAKSKYKKMKRKSKTLRRTYLESLAEALAEAKNTTKLSQIKELINREKLKETYRKIKIARGAATSNQNFSSVSVSNQETGERVIYTEKSQIEEQIIQNNKNKFMQTQGQCPLMKGTFREALGTTADTSEAAKVITGEYELPTRCRKSVKEFLSACKKPGDFKSLIDHHLSLEQYRKKWALAKERTSAGKAHFGMWKAGARHAVLGRLEWILSTIPFTHGFSPDVWKTATDVMILKASGKTDLDSLRTVVLYEADFNFMNKQIGRAAVENALINKQMATEQYAKSRSSPIDQCISRRIVFDLNRFQKSSLVVCSTDLLSCYDRIVHTAASLAMQRYGITKEAMSSMFSTIQRCRHKVRTGLGTSEKSYGGLTPGEDPLMGVGQGNGAGPAIWSIISCVLFRIMHLKGFHSSYKAKLSQDSTELMGFMYVDDNDLIIKGEDETHRGLIDKSQSILSSWNKLIKVSGGAIRMDKSNWYGFYHNWNEEEGEYDMQDIQETSLEAKNQFGVRLELPQLSCYTPQKILGHVMAPDGDNSHQVSKLIEVAKSEASSITRSKLSPSECHLALTHTIIPRIFYPLIATTISKEDSKKIMRPVLDACLPKMRLAKTTGYDFIHGAIESNGLGIPEPYHYSFGHQIEQVISHVWKNTQTGKLILMEIQELWIELGTKDIFDVKASPRIQEGQITRNSWISSIREYMVENNITLHIPFHPPGIARRNDEFIMDVMARLPYTSISKKEFKAFNYCRLYKRVRTLADLLDSTGRKIAERAWDANRFSRENLSEFNTLHRPSAHQWKAWKKGLKALQRENRFELGEWRIPDSRTLIWDFFLDQREHRLLLVQGGKWKSFALINRRWTGSLRFSKEHTNVTQVQVAQLQRTTIRIREEFLEVEGSHQGYDIVIVDPQPKAISTVIGHLPNLKDQADIVQWITSIKSNIPEADWAFQSITLVGDPQKLLQDFINGKAVLVGDGSFKCGWGAGASIIASSEGDSYIIASGPTPGPPHIQSAYRSELGALVGCFLLRMILSIATNSAPKIVVACDNDKALQKSITDQDFIKIGWKHSDLISAIADIRSSIDGDTTIKYVKGHSDSEKRWDELSILEKLNVKADEEAKQCRAQLTSHVHRSRRWDLGYGQVIIDDIPATACPSKAIQAKASRQRGHQARARVNARNTQFGHLIDEKSLEQSLGRLTLERRILIMKLVSRQLPVGKVMVQRRHRLSNICPQCQEEVETIDHLFTCKSWTSIQSFDTALSTLDRQLSQIDTDPVLSAHLVETLRLWKRQGKVLYSVYPSSIMNYVVFQAFAEQGKIGWDRMFEGHISKKWAIAQQRYLSNQPQTRKHQSAWATKFIGLLWEFFHTIWTARNAILHESDTTMETVSGGYHLEEAIRYEFNQGIHELHKDFSRLFSRYSSVETLIGQPLQARLQWFKTIRTAREATSTSRIDIFSNNGPLRSWIGLSKR